jgi:ribosomal 50S subunit-recycling heat shock protein
VRLDLFLKNTGIIPRRAVAKSACEQGLIEINGKPAKPAAEVRVGDRLLLRIGLRVAEYEVLATPTRAVAKTAREDYARLLRTERLDEQL